MVTTQPLSITAEQVTFRTHLEAELASVIVQLDHVDRRYARDRAKLARQADELRRRIDLEG